MMRALLVALTGCGFNVTATPSDAPGDTPPVDTPIDVTDVAIARVTSGLIGFWTFNEMNDTVYAFDTSGATPPVNLEVVRTVPAPTFSNGVLNAEATGRLVSLQNSRLSSDCSTANGVTLEVWVRASAGLQGTPGEPSYIAGLSSTVTTRNIALMQGSDRWIAQVRTSSPDGKPNLVSVSSVSTAAMTHVAVVADGATRSLVINGVVEASSPAGSLSGWDLSFPMTVVDEYQHARQWVGSVALVAMYRRALTVAELQQNYMAGSNH
jgi:hypothetical protein